MQVDSPETVTIKGSWLNACGKGTEDLTVPVIKTNLMNNLHFDRVTMPDGGEWEVIREWRCVK